MIKSLLLMLAFSVTQNLVFEKSYTTDATDFKVDELGNLYLIHQSYVERINASNSAKFRTSEMNYGNIDFLDLTNPLKPFIHYAGIGKIVVFDNTLSQQGDPIDLWAYGYTQVEMIAGSRGDAYWLWDARNSELIRVDGSFNRLTSTGNLSVLLSKTIQPVQILERGQQVYLRDSVNGLIVLDVYGKYRTTLNLLSDQDIQVIEDDIVYLKDRSLHILSRDWITEDVITLPELPASRVQWFKQRCYFLLETDSLQVYKLM